MAKIRTSTRRSNRIKDDPSSRVYTVCIYIITAIITLILVYPFYFCIIASFSDPNAVALGDTIFWFKGFTTKAYEAVFKEHSLWVGYRNSFIYMVLGTCYHVLLTIPAAYVCSKTKLYGHRFILWFFFLTMYFSGGTIPTYLWNKQLGLVNNPLVMIIGVGVNTYYMIIVRQFFISSIPGTLFEAAEIDGASDLQQFFRIAIPLAKPVIAVIALYYAFNKWNSYYTALIYLKNKEYWPLQLVLRQILIASETAVRELAKLSKEESNYLTKQLYLVRAMKYSIILIASVPMLVLYPFVSKYFTKGVMIGSIKE